MTNPPGYPQDPSQQPYCQQSQSGGYQGGQYQQPAAGYAQSAPAKTGFLGALFDFSFREFITTRIIKIVYILWLVMIGVGFLFGLISSIAMMNNDEIGFLGFPMLIGTLVGTVTSVLLSRIVLELLIVVFRISEDLNAIRKRGGM